MRIRYFTSMAIILGGIAAFVGLSSNSSGNSTPNCSPCHGSASGTTVMNFFTNPSLVTGYLNNTTYVCTLAVQNATSGLTHAGFTMNTNQGTFSLPAGATGMSTNGSNIGHNAKAVMTSTAGSTPTAVWIFNWQSPSSNVGTVTFTVGGNCVNNNGTTSGDAWNQQAFSYSPSTGASAPTISNVSVSNITTNAANVNATVNANGANTTVFVEYGTTTAYGSAKNTTPPTVNGTSPTSVVANLTGLNPGTTYHYRVSALSVAGSVNSPDATFTTQAAQSLQDLSVGGFKLYPIPSTTDKVYLENTKGLAIREIKILDLSGRGYTIPSTTAGDITTINTSSLSKGNYVIRVLVNNDWYAKHICVQ